MVNGDRQAQSPASDGADSDIEPGAKTGTEPIEHPTTHAAVASKRSAESEQTVVESNSDVGLSRGQLMDGNADASIAGEASRQCSPSNGSVTEPESGLIAQALAFEREVELAEIIAAFDACAASAVHCALTIDTPVDDDHTYQPARSKNSYRAKKKQSVGIQLELPWSTVVVTPNDERRVGDVDADTSNGADR